MTAIASHDGQVVDQRGGRNLFIEGILSIGNAQPPPDVRNLLIKRQDGARIFDGDSIKPARQEIRLNGITAMTNNLDPASYLTNGDNRQ